MHHICSGRCLCVGYSSLMCWLRTGGVSAVPLARRLLGADTRIHAGIPRQLRLFQPSSVHPGISIRFVHSRPVHSMLPFFFMLPTEQIQREPRTFGRHQPILRTVQRLPQNHQRPIKRPNSALTNTRKSHLLTHLVFIYL